MWPAFSDPDDDSVPQYVTFNPENNPSGWTTVETETHQSGATVETETHQSGATTTTTTTVSNYSVTDPNTNNARLTIDSATGTRVFHGDMTVNGSTTTTTTTTVTNPMTIYGDLTVDGTTSDVDITSLAQDIIASWDMAYDNGNGNVIHYNFDPSANSIREYVESFGYSMVGANGTYFDYHPFLRVYKNENQDIQIARPDTEQYENGLDWLVATTIWDHTVDIPETTGDFIDQLADWFHADIELEYENLFWVDTANYTTVSNVISTVLFSSDLESESPNADVNGSEDTEMIAKSKKV